MSTFGLQGRGDMQMFFMDMDAHEYEASLEAGIQSIDTPDALSDFLTSLTDRGMSPESTAAVEHYVTECWDKGVEVVLDPTMTDSLGTYAPGENILTLGGGALDCNVELVETLEHEFIHVLQDQVAGIDNSDMGFLGLGATEAAVETVSTFYADSSFFVQALEVEAFVGEELLEAASMFV